MGIIFTIFRKELTDTLRDRRTVITMVLIPLLLIPLIITGLGKVRAIQSEVAEMKNPKVALVSNGNGEELVKRLKRRKDMDIREDLLPQQFRQYIQSDSIDAGLIIEEGFDQSIENGNTAKVSFFCKTLNDTLLHYQLIQTINSYRADILQNRMEKLGVTTELIRPLKVQYVTTTPVRNRIGKFAGGLLPYFFVLFCFLGAMYPAIDLFTGEKEQSTIETLLATPASRLQILLGKTLVIVFTGVISGMLSILGLVAVLRFNSDIPVFISGIAMQLLDIRVIAMVVLMMIPLTTFFSGILIPASIYARSFKEAQSLIQPLIFLIVIPLVIAFFPGVDLNFTTALVPVLNVALATREIVAGTIKYDTLIVAYISLFIFAGIGIYTSSRWFGYEGNIFRV